MTTTKPTTNAMTKADSIAAAWSWLSSYEATDTPAEKAGDYFPTIELGDAVTETREHYAGKATRVTASIVARRYPEFPADMVAAYFWLEAESTRHHRKSRKA